MKIALVTGGFDPLHSGHIKYMKAARKMGDKLMVGTNSDDWLTNKKGKIIFCNGGDREKKNIPEYDMYIDEPRVEFKDGVGGMEKVNSSSWIVLEYLEGIQK